MQFAEKCIVVDFKNISVHVFDMLTTENGMMILDEDVSYHFHCAKLKCSDEGIWNPEWGSMEYGILNSDGGIWNPVPNVMVN